ncbi:MAG: MaoC family dehydratase N-terminal domain-containing protein [Deltaproteobacteria bacterium]|nr:MaoC family dehydratase N-terminal domain-containing protein [Deltaproteobacteria bacterium]
MKLSSGFAGSTLKEYDCAVSTRWIMNYAAAIGDPNPRYFNDERQEGIVAPPMFPAAATWPILENIADYIEAEAFPKEVLITQVHYTEHLTIHQAVTPGSNLKIRGAIAAILPHRAGSHVVIRFDATDAKGTPIFTEHIGAMMRGITCADRGKGGDRLPVVPHQEETSPPCWELMIPVDPLAPFIYDGCTNIHFPIHTSVKFAHEVGLPGIILQGTFTLALAVHQILNTEACGDPQRIHQVYCRFTDMVIPGSAIKIRLTGKSRALTGTNLFFTVLNAADKPAISDGYIRLKD